LVGLTLPPNITRLTFFGERPDWSADGKKLIFVEKTFGDVFESEIFRSNEPAGVGHGILLLSIEKGE
jgi:hypothetical protein